MKRAALRLETPDAHKERATRPHKRSGVAGWRSDTLSRKAVELALEGDTTALRLCLERIVPPRKDAPVTFDLPAMQCAGDAAKAAGTVLQGVALGELTPTEGAHVMALIETYRRILETTEIEQRIAALEAEALK